MGVLHGATNQVLRPAQTVWRSTPPPPCTPRGAPPRQVWQHPRCPPFFSAAPAPSRSAMWPKGDPRPPHPPPPKTVAGVAIG